jgi:hypothetical protein
MNREVSRPAHTLQAARAGRVGQPATDLIESGLRILSAKSGIRRVRRGQTWENRQCRRNSQRRPVQHVASPQQFPRIEYNAAIRRPSGFQSGDRHVSESCAAVVCCYHQAGGLADTTSTCSPLPMSPEATQVRSALALLILVSCAGCADVQKSIAQAPAPQPAAAPANPPPVADAAPARFECSDGTISSSQDACLIAMAKARLPPSPSVERTGTTR